MALLVAGITAITVHAQNEVTEWVQDGTTPTAVAKSAPKGTPPAGLATAIQVYPFWISLPDANRATNSFPVARDSLMAALKMGGVFDNRGRESSPTGLDIRNRFDSGDVTTSTNRNLWRFQFAPTNAFVGEWGNRGYCAVLIVGVGGKINIERLSWKVFGGVLSGERSLSGFGYSITRIGVNTGPDGKLWTADDIFVSVGDGTALVDAIAYIGASLSSPNVNDSLDQQKIEGYFTNGLPVMVEFQFDTGAPNPAVFRTSTTVYAMGQVSQSAYGWVPIKTPYGLLYSLVAPQGSRYEIGRMFGQSRQTGYASVSASAPPGFSLAESFLQGTNYGVFFRIHRVQ